MNVADFDYPLPEELIAQAPSAQRDASRLMVVHRSTGELEDKHFYDIVDFLKPGDLLVMNNSRVIPARIYGTKRGTGAHIELLLTKDLGQDQWQSLVRPGKRLHVGDIVDLPAGVSAEIMGNSEGGTRILKFHYQGIFMEKLAEIGSMPLPPYIRRQAQDTDKERYQTVYSKIDGSVAAPTAGLHFTPELLQKIQEKGVGLAEVTLHVGIGTFRPVTADTVEEHHMHFEEYFIDQETAQKINDTKKAGGRIISVGTTSTRTLESATGEDGLVKAGQGSTDIFIYPGYTFKMVDSLITNFHLPKSTLMMLISALYDREKILQAYNHAVEERYRFFSYGDAMFIE